MSVAMSEKVESLESISRFADRLLNHPERFVDDEAKLLELNQAILYITKALYDTVSDFSKVHTPKVPLGPLPQLLTEGFETEQVWEQLHTRNDQLHPHLKRSLKRLLSFATSQLAAAPRPVAALQKSRKRGQPTKTSAPSSKLGSDSDEGGPLETAFFFNPTEAEVYEEEEDEEQEGLSSELGELDDEELSDFGLEEFGEDGEAEEEDAKDEEDVSDWDQSDPGEDPFDPDELARFLEVTDKMDAKLFGNPEGDDTESDPDSDELAADEILYGLNAKKRKPARGKKALPAFADPLDDQNAFSGDDDGVEEQELGDNFQDQKKRAIRDPLAGDGLHSDSDSGSDAKESGKISRFLRDEQRKRQEISKLEKQSVAPKEWTLTGETTAKSRPKNSLLEVDVEFEHATEPAPLITEDYTAKLEQMITRRIIEKRFDDVARKTQADVDARSQPKVVADVQDTQSQLGLAEEYEKKFMEDAGKWKKVEKSDEVHTEVLRLFKRLSTKLDALANFSYLPKLPAQETTVLSNVPAIRMEEVAPVGTSDAALLAPEEVLTRLKGQSEAAPAELSHEERRTIRSSKKKLRRKELRTAAADASAVNKANPGMGNKFAKERAIKELAQARNVDIGKEGFSSVTGSTALFKQLQEEAASVARQLSSQVSFDPSASLPSGKGYSKGKKKRAPSFSHKM